MIADYYKADDFLLYYELHGDISRHKTLIVFLHEGLGSVSQWKGFPQKLAQKLDVPILMYDRIGYGKSTPVKGVRKSDYLHQEADFYFPELLDYLSVDKPVNLFGHSDGATLALIIASRFPEMINKLIVEAPHVVIEEQTAQAIFTTISEWEQGKLKARMARHHPGHAESMFWSWAGFWASPDNLTWEIIQELQQITSPVMFVQGTEDIFGSYQQAKVIRENIKGTYRELYIENCGHIPHLEYEQLLLSQAADFFH